MTAKKAARRTKAAPTGPDPRPATLEDVPAAMRAKIDALLARPFEVPAILEMCFTDRVSTVHLVTTRIGETGETLHRDVVVSDVINRLEADALVLLWAIREARKFIGRPAGKDGGP